MKKILKVLLALTLVFSLTGCGMIQDKIGEMAGKAIAENVLKGAGLDVDIQDDNVVIKGEDGEELNIGGGEWPKTDLAKNIPELKKGKIVSKVESDEAIYIMLDEVSDKDFKEYLEKIKETFNVEAYEATADTTWSYVAKDGKGLGIMLIYDTESGLSITLSKSE